MWHKHADRPGSSYWMTVLHIRSQKFLLIQKISLRLHLSISCLVNFCFLTTHNGTMAINQTQKNENKFIQHENKLIHNNVKCIQIMAGSRKGCKSSMPVAYVYTSPMHRKNLETKKNIKNTKTDTYTEFKQVSRMTLLCNSILTSC